ncbi:MAG TPA: glycosyltransferase family 2 protein [Longimicrobium sp.]|nr:glycosyltransferase family 2 protein [Longimicrobium sp.]
MDDALFWLAAFCLLVLLATLVEVGRGGRSLVFLRDVAPFSDAEMPSVSVVAAARNEARGIEAALRSVLAQEGPEIEVIIVDDRSDDATPEILERMAGENARLKVIHVAELPPKWLGKNHALWVGAQAARGELLLFTDADVVLAPDTLRRAAAHLARGGYAHVTAGPRVVMPGWLLQTFGVFFGLLFTLFSRPWRARDPRSIQHVGVGAFNLLPADVYRRIGTHRAIAMRPDDDMKLGKLVKKAGLSQDFVIGAGFISVEWYHSVREAVRGLRKNGFAGVDYRVSMVLFATVSVLLLFVWPFVAVFVTGGWTRALYGGVVLIHLVMFGAMAREQGVRWWYGLTLPAAALLFLFVVWNAMLYALLRGGIEWRGTHYPLDELRANRV